MRMTICAVGRLKSGPELALVNDYLGRAERTGRSLGLAPFSVEEVSERKGKSKSEEGQLLLRSVREGTMACALDERGKPLNSREFAEQIGTWRDQGVPEAAFIIGGADGLSDTVRARADLSLSLGSMVWPHMLARVMLAEQLYRATQILAGTPYHRA